jgi:transposase
MLGKKSDKPRRKYDEEFKKDVLKMIINGRAVQEVSQSLGINCNMIHKWKAQQNASIGSSQSAPNIVIASVTGAEHERIKARLREVEQERDILKKALGIFSRGI